MLLLGDEEIVVSYIIFQFSMLQVQRQNSYIKVMVFHIPYLWDIYSPKKIYKYSEESFTKEFLIKYDTYNKNRRQN